jgi:hypothetical protein
MKDEGAIDWWEGFSNFHWTRKQVQGGVLEGSKKKRNILCFEGKNKRENGSVRKRLVLKYGKMLFMKKMCANKSMEGSCV